MRRAFLISVLASFTTIVSAQKIELGLNGGILAHNTYGYYRGSSLGHGNMERGEILNYSSLKASAAFKKWQIGVGIDKYSTETMLPSRVWGRPYMPALYSLTPHVFGNMIFRLPKSLLYGGIHAGIVTGKMVIPTDVSNIFIKDNFSGFTGGFQTGYTHYFMKHLGVNADFSARYQEAVFRSFSNSKAHQYIYSMALGLRYSL